MQLYIARSFILMCVIFTTQLGLSQRVVTGNIIDAEYQEALIGANVFVKGQAIGTVTDYDGNFSLEVPDTASILVFILSGSEPRCLHFFQ